MTDIIIVSLLALGVVVCCAFMAIIQVFLNGYERRQEKPVYKSELERIMEEIDKGVIHA